MVGVKIVYESHEGVGVMVTIEVREVSERVQVEPHLVKINFVHFGVRGQDDDILLNVVKRGVVELVVVVVRYVEVFGDYLLYEALILGVPAHIVILTQLYKAVTLLISCFNG